MRTPIGINEEQQENLSVRGKKDGNYETNEELMQDYLGPADGEKG
jgi:hypothetical protein